MDPYRWSLDAETFALVPGLVLAYGVALRLYGGRRRQVVLYAVGVALLLAVFATPVETLALRYLLTAHLLQNVVLAEWAPAFLVFGLPAAAAAALGRVPVVRALTRPALALPLWVATYFAWHLPWVYDFALRHPQTVLHAEHLSYLAAGSLLWWPIAQRDPWRLAAGAKALYLFVAFVLASPLGLLLALLPRAIYGYYVHGPHVWGLAPLVDQQIAGASMAAEQAVVFFAFFAFWFLRFLSEEASAGVYQPPSSAARTSSTPAAQTRSTSSSGRS